MADQKINELPVKMSPASGDKMLMIGVTEEYQIDYELLATAILNKLTSKTFVFTQGTKTLPDAIEQLSERTECNLLPEYIIKKQTQSNAQFEYLGQGAFKLTATSSGSPAYSYCDAYLDKNKIHTLSWKSTRTGVAGGGLILQGRKNDGTSENYPSQSSVLNGECSFDTKEFDYIRFIFYGATGTVTQGESATFMDIMLVEGCIPSPYIPDAYKQTELATVVNKRSAVNLFDFATHFSWVRSEGTSDDNVLTVKCTNVSGIPYAQKEITNVVENNKVYTLSFESTRTGNYGGGAYVVGKDSSGQFTTIAASISVLNAIVAFDSGDYENVYINFVGGTVQSQIGDSATFTDIMLVEGSFEGRTYVPYIGFETLSEAIADLAKRIEVLEG